MNINELEELAKAATPGPWLCDWTSDATEDENEPADVSVWQGKLFSGKFIGNISFDNSIPDGNYIAAANPSSILELTAAYREAIAAINKIQNECDLPTWFDGTLDSIHATAKNLGVK